jgi:hypothetical protein
MWRIGEDLSSGIHELAADTTPATTQEIQQMEEDQANEETFSQAIEAILETTTARRKRMATPKAVDSAIQARDAKRAKSGGRGGHGGCGRG